MTQSVTPEVAIQRLKDGNKRFVQGVKSIDSLATYEQRQRLAEDGQRPFAIILGCSDSRAPAELVFDAGLGDLFVIRVAGNIVAPSLLGSIEFAATNFGTPLCIVLGHSKCGAVSATTTAITEKKRAATDYIQAIILEIEPSVKQALKDDPKLTGPDLVTCAVKLNVEKTMERICERSHVIADLVASGSFKVIGGIYDLHSGKVDFINT
jgi:carbonic anhydrase